MLLWRTKCVQHTSEFRLQPFLLTLAVVLQVVLVIVLATMSLLISMLRLLAGEDERLMIGLYRVQPLLPAFIVLDLGHHLQNCKK